MRARSVSAFQPARVGWPSEYSHFSWPLELKQLATARRPQRELRARRARAWDCFSSARVCLYHGHHHHVPNAPLGSGDLGGQ